MPFSERQCNRSPLHKELRVLLTEYFGDRIICMGLWCPLLPVLNLYNFYLPRVVLKMCFMDPKGSAISSLGICGCISVIAALKFTYLKEYFFFKE
jgi:hypothetical protein